MLITKAHTVISSFRRLMWIGGFKMSLGDTMRLCLTKQNQTKHTNSKELKEREVLSK